MRLGMREGFTLPAEILDGVSKVIAGEQFAKPEDCPLYRPFANFPPTVAPTDRERLRAAGQHRDRGCASFRPMPASSASSKMSTGPRARRTIAATALPDGTALLRRSGALLHDLARRHARGQVHATGSGGSRAYSRRDGRDHPRGGVHRASFAEFLTFLRTDPQFYATTPNSCCARQRGCPSRSMGSLPTFFGHLPRTPYGVRPVPERTGPQLHGRPLQPGRGGRRRRILGEHVRARTRARSMCCRR